MSFADGSPLAFILAAVIAAVALLAVGLYLAHSRLGAGKPDIASATLHGAGPFTLTVAAPPAGPVDLFIRYAVAFPFFKPSGGPTSRTFGLIVELVADGQVLTFGHGGTHPAGLLEFEGLAHYMTSFRPGNPGEPTRYTASVLVKSFSSCPRTLSGVVRTAEGTTLATATLTLR
ncbi:hypothetical protein [Sorangium sp. So ce363]|uniref:hypothetical protein n=1 Tax=Sorangium sp. So ce363 TaxID=3133304 RepID=UPI003F63C757